MWNYPQEFASLSRRLRVENDIFRNALELLLHDCVDDDELTNLLSDPGGELWRDPAINDELLRKMQRSFHVFIETIKSMHRSLQEFTRRLKLDPDGKGPFTDPKSFKEAYKRFRFGLKRSAYMDLVNEISRDNAALTKLTEQSSALEPVRAVRGRRMPDFDNIRSKAASLFGTLQRGFHDSCSAPHKASLYLKDSDDYHIQGSFRVVLHHQTGGSESRVVDGRTTSLAANLHHAATPTGAIMPSWVLEETEVRAMDSGNVSRSIDQLSAKMQALGTKKRGVTFQINANLAGNSSAGHAQTPQANVLEIHDLCRQLSQLPVMRCDMCLGYLLDASLNRHGLYWPRQPVVDKDTMTTVSLASVLSNLTVADSRRLALTLASGMLRLHDTPWLAKQWGRNEVILFKKGDMLLTQHPFISAEVAAIHMTSASASSPPASAPPAVPAIWSYFTSSPSIRNETIFALGILLIELCMRKSFDELVVPSDLNPDGTKHPASDFFAANRLLDQVSVPPASGYTPGQPSQGPNCPICRCSV